MYFILKIGLYLRKIAFVTEYRRFSCYDKVIGLYSNTFSKTGAFYY